MSDDESCSPPGFGGLIGVSPKMQHVYQLIVKISRHTYPVLILGETGTGKELVARSIHYLGARRHKPFVPVDCAALVSTLIESELFGHVKGAFSGAVLNKRGLLEAANEGTLFLDEIGDLPLDLQAKLLRTLQEQEVKPVGATKSISLNVRVVAATNRDLETAIRNGRFRQDLYYRLNVVQIKLPSLRERKADIPLLVNYFLEKFRDSQRRVPTISQGFIQRLVNHDWPGNVRELENAVRCAAALSSGPVLDADDLPLKLHCTSIEHLPEDDAIVPLKELERRAIFHALRETSGNKNIAAKLLGMGRTTLYRKLKQYSSSG